MTRVSRRVRSLPPPVVDRTLGFQNRWRLALFAAGLLFVGSAIPLPSRYNPDFGLFGPDKLLHLIGHAGFSAALVTTLSDDGSTVRVVVIAATISTVFGLITERFQEVVPGREFEWGDVIAGLLGSILGAVSFGWTVRQY